MGIREWSSQMLGGDDIWTTFQFDSAVSYFGIWVENRLNEYDYSNPKKPKPKYQLKDLLSAKPAAPVALKGQGISSDVTKITRRKRN